MVGAFPSGKEWFPFFQEHCLPLALSPVLGNEVSIHPRTQATLETSLVLNSCQQVVAILLPQYCWSLSLPTNLCDLSLSQPQGNVALLRPNTKVLKVCHSA